MKNRKYVISIAAVMGMSLLVACGGKQEHAFAGRTMGTTYHIKVVAGRSVDIRAVQAKVDARLVQVNQSMSTYQADSEISRFNRFSEVDQPFAVSADFLQVMLSARAIYRMTEGAFDPTVNPLVNLWGFGKAGPLKQVPSNEAVREARRKVGFEHIEVVPAGYLIKKVSDVTLDLAAIAKGYGVDQVAIVLHSLGFKKFLVEIGGEVYAVGTRPDGKPWRVGINRPQADAAADAVYKVVRLQNSAMATSGDYRNFYEIQGHIYSHIINPLTGDPVQNSVVSTSVVADNCTLADGLATGLMVMGPARGIALLDRQSGVEGMMIVRRPEGAFQNYLSRGMATLMAE